MVTTPSGCGMQLGAADLDILDFEEMADRGAGLIRNTRVMERDLQTRRDLLEESLMLWRGSA